MTHPDPTATNIAICEALGLDPKRIRKNGVTIHLDSNLGPVVTVEYQKYDADIGAVLTALKRYRLYEPDKWDEEPPPPSRSAPTPHRNPSDPAPPPPNPFHVPAYERPWLRDWLRERFTRR